MSSGGNQFLSAFGAGGGGGRGGPGSAAGDGMSNANNIDETDLEEKLHEIDQLEADIVVADVQDVLGERVDAEVTLKAQSIFATENPAAALEFLQQTSLEFRDLQKRYDQQQQQVRVMATEGSATPQASPLTVDTRRSAFYEAVHSFLREGVPPLMSPGNDFNSRMRPESMAVDPEYVRTHTNEQEQQQQQQGGELDKK